MLFLSSFLFLLFLIVSPVFAQVGSNDCRNPMFANVPLTLLGGKPIALRSSPLTGDVEAFCPNVANGPSCCSSTANQQARDTAKRFDQFFNQYRTTTIGLDPDQFLRSYIDNGIVWSVHQQQAVRTLIQALQPLWEPLGKCFQAMNGYFQGLYCLSCSPNYSAFFDPAQPVTAARPYPTLLLQQETCDAVWSNGCGEAFTLFIDSLSILIDGALMFEQNPMPYAQTPLTQLIPQPYLNYWKTLSKQKSNLCSTMPSVRTDGGKNTCRDYVCSGLLRGADYDFSPFPSRELMNRGRRLLEDTTPIVDQEGTVVNTFPKTIALLEDMFHVPKDSLKALLAASEEKFLQDQATSSPVNRHLLQQFNFKDPLSFFSAANGSGTQSNGRAYIQFVSTGSTNGFAAYTVGCTQSLSQTGCPLLGGLSSTAIASIVICSILGAIGLFLLVVKLLKKGKGELQFSKLVRQMEHAALDEQNKPKSDDVEL